MAKKVIVVSDLSGEPIGKDGFVVSYAAGDCRDGEPESMVLSCNGKTLCSGSGQEIAFSLEELVKACGQALRTPVDLARDRDQNERDAAQRGGPDDR